LQRVARRARGILSYVRPAIGEGDFVFRIELDSVENDRPAIIKILNAWAIDGGARPAKTAIYDIDRAIVRSCSTLPETRNNPRLRHLPPRARVVDCITNTARQNSTVQKCPSRESWRCAIETCNELVQANQNIVSDAWWTIRFARIRMR
jgi:hypothetical protein